MKSYSLSILKNVLTIIVGIVGLITGAVSGDDNSLKLIWSDEFDGPAGSAVDPQNWIYDIGGNGWTNNELQYYTNNPENSGLDGNGNLMITSLNGEASRYTCWYGPCQYTSARLLTKGHFSTKYGRIEANIRIPYGRGVWPAFWMKGDNCDDIGWPACGEVDIMEIRGSEPNITSGTIHGPGYAGQEGLNVTKESVDGRPLSDEHHLYAIDWWPDRVSWLLDGEIYGTLTKTDLLPGTNWTLDHDYFIILNVAIGGDFDGNPLPSTLFPQTMLIDYVRVYERSNAMMNRTSANLIILIIALTIWRNF